MNSTTVAFQSNDKSYLQQEAHTYFEPVSENPEYVENAFLEQTTRWIPRSPFASPFQAATLEKPVAIPRLDVNSTLSSPLPFLRAYSPALQLHAVHEQEFVAFIDNLTIAQTAPAVLQALNVAGTGIGFVPWHWAILAGLGINAAAIAGSKMITKQRTKRYLEAVNREYFAPRGLKVSLYMDDELAALVRYPQNQPDLAQIDSRLMLINVRQRRMQMLSPFVAPLSIDVPPPMPQTKFLDKMTAKQVAHKMGKQEKKILKKQEKTRENEWEGIKEDGSESKDNKKVRKMEYIVIENL
ncbi:hypothetical protein EG329_002313 [Mollisiaceae sp. DMI_Dod_QoI]|nr:hypothetical protein EG329_002313 [Helotiales sp. DMI_Dod_QoI]